VSAENTARVRDAVATLGYRANDVARSLRRRQRVATIGLIVEDIQQRSRGRGDGTPQWAHRRHRQLRGNPKAEREAVGMLLSRQVAGLLVVPPGHDHSHVLDVIRRGTPCVSMGRPPERVQGVTILLDNAGGARKAAHHFTRLGHPGSVWSVIREPTTPSEIEWRGSATRWRAPKCRSTSPWSDWGRATCWRPRPQCASCCPCPAPHGDLCNQ
jgi:DNA-binding LacI/PurR family transcriptional regulator